MKKPIFTLAGTILLTGLFLLSCQIDREMTTFEKKSTIQNSEEESSTLVLEEYVSSKASDSVRIGKDDSISGGTNMNLTSSQAKLQYK